MSYSSIAWLPLAAGLTILGLVLSYLTYQRRGLRPALMGVALSLLPIAAYLTGAIEMLWKVGARSASSAPASCSPRRSGRASASPASRSRSSSPRAAGSAARPRVRRAGPPGPSRKDGPRAAAGPAPRLAAPGPRRALATRRTAQRRSPPTARPPRRPAKASRKAAPPVDDDMKDIEDILRKRGI